MKIAVLSDIHSNQFALAAVVAALNDERPDLVILLGDTFGYYPWAVETFRLVQELSAIGVLGNHDQLVLDSIPPEPIPSYWGVAKHNERALAKDSPEALTWLKSLKPSRYLRVGEHRIQCCHGTPVQPLEGRYYPDDTTEPDWLPHNSEIVLLGHTHHSLEQQTKDGGLVANPGSVGQPRDGDRRASWGILFPLEMRFELRRTEYDIERAVELLRNEDWYRVAIEGLCKVRNRGERS